MAECVKQDGSGMGNGNQTLGTKGFPKETTLPNEAAVAILPYGSRLGIKPGKLRLNDLNWPLSQPKQFEGRNLKDLDSSDHLILYPRRQHYFNHFFGCSAKVSIMLVEPCAVHSHHVKLLRRFHWRFFRVLTVVQHLLEIIPNGVFFPFGSTWVPDWQTTDVTKTRMVSSIASDKRSLPGHLRRHEIAAWVQAENLDLDLIGRGYRPFDRKSDGLAPYRFSVIIENSIEPNYFTEKLIDSILCETIPIYLGCPNIGQFLDTRAMIICQNTDDIRRALLTLSIEQYFEKLPFLRAIKDKAAWFGKHETRAARIVLDAGRPPNKQESNEPRK